MSYSLEFENGFFHLKSIEYFSPELIFDCGQCFRFDKISENTYAGVALGKYITVTSNGKDEFLIGGFSEKESDLLRDFFALDDDYGKMRKEILDSMALHNIDTTVMEKAMEVGKGIRLLHQEKFECICSFIISQNNNIPRIKKIINTLCLNYGDEFEQNGVVFRAFPTSKALFEAGEEGIFACKTGFRAKYLTDAARLANEGFMETLHSLSDEELSRSLMTVKGIGPKVSSCITLFGFGRLSSFPVDVWVKRVMSKYYPENTPPYVFGKYAGLAQQYLFYYERYVANNHK